MFKRLIHETVIYLCHCNGYYKCEKVFFCTTLGLKKTFYFDLNYTNLNRGKHFFCAHDTHIYNIYRRDKLSQNRIKVKICLDRDSFLVPALLFP